MQQGSLKATIVLALSLALGGCGKPIREQLKDFGYSELQPPSLLLPPGTIVTVKQSDPLMVGIICRRESAFGADIVAEVLSSPSVTSTQSKKLEGSFDLDATYVTGLAADAKVEGVEGINVTMANVVIEELPDEAVIALIPQRNKSCADAMALRRGQNAKVSLIKSVVSADVTYVIRYSSSVNANAKAELTKKVAARLGMSATTTGETSVSGTHLLWGARDDVELAAYTGGGLAATGSASRTHVMNPGQIVLGVDEQ